MFLNTKLLLAVMPILLFFAFGFAPQASAAGEAEVSLDTSTPASASISPGQKSVVFTQVKVSAIEEISVKKIVLYTDSVLSNFGQVKIYDGSTFLGSAYIVGGDTLVYLENELIVPAFSSKILTIKSDVSSVAEGAMRLGINELTYTVSETAEIKTLSRIDPPLAMGNTMTVAISSEPSITVLSPNGGEEWVVGQTYRIEWESNNIDSVRIYIVDDSVFGSGSTNYIIPDQGSAKASVGYYDWTIDAKQLPKVPSGTGAGDNYHIRIDGFGEGGLGDVVVRDSSDAKFSVVVEPLITVTSPNGGEEWVIGNTYEITWEASEINSVDITLLHYSSPTARGVPYTITKRAPATSGKFSWKVSSAINEEFWVGGYNKISLIGYATVSGAEKSFRDESDNYFSIVASSPPTDLPDLEITALTWRPQFPKGGETISFAATVKNNSEVDVNQPFKVNVGGTSTIIPSLAANETASAQATFGLTKVGPNKVYASVDYESVIKESNEANNDYIATVKIAPTYSGEGAFKLAHWETLQLANGIIIRAIGANVRGQEPYKAMFQIYSSDYDLITATGKLLAGDVWSFGAGNGAISGDINIEVNSFDVRAPGNANWSVSINASSVDVEKLNVDLKINGSDTPSPVAYNSTFLASWSSKGAVSCSAFSHFVPSVGGEIWTDFKDLPTSGDIDMYAKHENFGYLSRLRFGMQCFDLFGKSVSDEVILPVLAPEATPELTDAPEMVYPKDKQILDLEGSYMFKVKPIAGATGYLFRLYQGGTLLYDNEQDDGKLSPDGEFAIHPDHLSHSKFKEGDVEVAVKAKVNGKWSKERIIIITLKPGEVDRSVRQCLAEGTLIKTPDDPKIYVIKDCKKKWIKTGEEFEEDGHKWEDVREAADPVVEAYADYLQAAANLLRAINQEKVYRVISGKKLWIPTASAFNAQKLSWEDVQETSEADVSAYPTARLIREKGDPKVYFITSNGFKKWIRTAAIFNSYSGNKWEDIVEVDQEVTESFEGVELIRLIGGTKVYKIEAGVKRWVKTESAFVRNNLDWKRIVSINQTELNYYQEGAVIE